MKNVITPLIALLFTANAQGQLDSKPAGTLTAPKKDGNTFTIPADNSYTRTGMMMNKGDTVYLKADGQIVAGPGVNLFQGGPVGPCGYSDVISAFPGTQQYNKYNSNDPDKTSHHAAFVALTVDNAGKVIAGGEYCELPDAEDKFSYKMYITKQAGELVLDINDKKQTDNSGKIKCTVATPGNR